MGVLSHGPPLFEGTISAAPCPSAGLQTRISKCRRDVKISPAMLTRAFERTEAFAGACDARRRAAIRTRIALLLVRQTFKCNLSVHALAKEELWVGFSEMF